MRTSAGQNIPMSDDCGGIFYANISTLLVLFILMPTKTTAIKINRLLLDSIQWIELGLNDTANIDKLMGVGISMAVYFLPFVRRRWVEMVILMVDIILTRELFLSLLSNNHNLKIAFVY